MNAEKSLQPEVALLEAILFLENDPIDLVGLAKIAKISEQEVAEALEILHDKCLLPDSGVELSELGGGFSLIPRRDLVLRLRHHYGRKLDEKMSRAALETLSIVAYSQPVTRAEIDGIRGVNSSSTLKVLTERGLVREFGRKDAPGRPAQYGTTKEFLQFFGLASIGDLPKLDEAERERFEIER